ncbi:MAG TPA: hypothetical protein VEZ41_11010 [Allosphingosinicella sp.]|nr:hypothetical protein [Allosphingosinicella sp.]
MSELIAPLSLAVSLVLVAAIVCGAGLAAWRGWLEYKRMELQVRRVPAAAADEDEPSEAGTGARIELAAVKERLRRLEAIANGVEL